VGELGFAGEPPKGSAQLVIGEATFCLPLGDLIDLKAEVSRLEKEVARMSNEIDRLEKKLGNDKFVANAPEEIVAAEREKLAEFSESRSRLAVALAQVRSGM
jgi:valyl-tRNA synthetase